MQDTPFIPAHRRQRKAEASKFEASLIFRESSRIDNKETKATTKLCRL